MKVKEESAKAELCLNMMKTNVVTTKEIHNFNIENVDIEIVKDFDYLGSVTNSNRSCSQEIKRRLRLGRAAIEEL